MTQLALITGATSGIGKALAYLLASHHISLILTGRNREELENLKKNLPVPVIIHAADLSQDRKELLNLIQSHAPDLIINSAGYGLYGEVLTHPLSEQMNLLEVNLKAALEITIVGVHTLTAKNKQGIILNISSAAAFFIYPTFALYAASKRSLLDFSLAFDEEVKPQGVRILTSCPGPVSTHFRERAASGYPQKRDPLAISPERAAELIWQQIEERKPLRIIDWKMALMVRLTRLIPPRLLAKALKHSLSTRYSDSR